MKSASLRTWIEIDKSAAKHNVETISRLVGPKVRLWAVVKSNAYGHGIFVIPQIIEKAGIYGFCVDSIIEVIKLREHGIHKPILVLGFTPPSSFGLAKAHNIMITISNFDVLKHFLQFKNPPEFHLKIDTGMHRQGFYSEEVEGFIKNLKTSKAHQDVLRGVYTHFSSAKDINYPGYTEMQLAKFLSCAKILAEAGFKNLMRHASATGGTLVDSKYHLDAVRVGIGLYGLWPSKELEIQLGDKIDLRPILSWHTHIAELKTVQKGAYIGYDLAEKAHHDSRIAILPIGYWHGFPRALSSSGSVLIEGKRAKVLGRVSMDMVAVDVTSIICQFGDKVTLIGKSGSEVLPAGEIAALTGTSHYEIVTRLNPLIERIAV
jgi:alanine racemase